MFKEFKEFALKGSLMDTAVAFVMGAAFGKVTDSFINGIIMPFISIILQKDLGSMKYVLKAAETAADGKVTAAEIAVKYGDLISVIMYFIVVAFVMFMIVKSMNAAKKKEAEAPPAAPPADITLLTEIRDLLKK
jgi:large conductance mechanosensitive channel